MDRRTVLKGLAASALVTATGKPSFAAPTRGGHMRLALAGGSSVASLDPTTYSDSGMYILAYATKSGLTEITSKSTVSPALAESWDFSKDARTWIFNLRKGVTFHSGKSLTADDVIASINLHRGPDSKSAGASWLSDVQDVKADGQNRVVFSLAGGNAEFAAVLSAVPMQILPSKGGEITDVATADGTGAYILEDFEPGARASVKRNPNYWNPDVGFVDSAEVLYVADAAARMNALRSGNVDIINRVDAKTARLLKRVPGLKVEEINGGLHDVFCMMTDVAPFNDPNVRLALKYAINRKEMVEKVLMGHGEVANDNPLAPSNPYYLKDLPQREYDPEKAKFYLNKAGLTSVDIPLSVSETGFPGATDAAVLYAGSAQEAGLNINVTREPDDGFFEKVWMKKPFTVDFWEGQATADMTLSKAYSATSPHNETHWKNPKFNELLIAARGETDEPKRRVMYQDMQQLIHDDGGAVIPMYVNHLWAVGSKVKHNEDISVDYDLDGMKCIQRWWLAD